MTIGLLTLGMAEPLLSQVTLTVNANMDLYRAGAYNDGSDGQTPAVYSFPAHPFQTLTFSGVNGTWTCATAMAVFGPDGTTTEPCAGRRFTTPTGSFSGYNLVDFSGGMVGMFLEDTLPASAPPSLLFYVSNTSHGGIATDFKTLTPLIGQVFFIGDGLTGTGTGSIQTFAVPSTATHLYLGFLDSCNQASSVPACYSDNAGSVSAIFQIQPHPLEWVQPALSQRPPGRCCAGFAYDYATQAVLLFGGFTNPTTIGDTWILRSGWTQLSPTSSPSPRQGQAMTWDGAARNIVLFGGMLGNGTYLNDTWTWDGITWTQQFPPVSPPGRRFDNASLAYDAATQTVLMFGGVGDSGGLGDTWIWNGITKTWTQQFPATSPSPRRAPFAYDYGAGTVVLFGGDNDGPALTDTWTWDGSNWTQHFPTSHPSPRSTPEMAYDNELSAVVLFGGYGGPDDNLNDTWTWNGRNWTQIHLATAPPGRWEAGMIYDPLAQGLVTFSGFGTTTLDDMWVLRLTP